MKNSPLANNFLLLIPPGHWASSAKYMECVPLPDINWVSRLMLLNWSLLSHLSVYDCSFLILKMQDKAFFIHGESFIIWICRVIGWERAVAFLQQNYLPPNFELKFIIGQISNYPGWNSANWGTLSKYTDWWTANYQSININIQELRYT